MFVKTQKHKENTELNLRTFLYQDHSLACSQTGADQLSKKANVSYKVSIYSYSSVMTRRVAGFKYLSFLLKLYNERRITNEPVMLKPKETLWLLFCSVGPLVLEYALFKLLGKL